MECDKGDRVIFLSKIFQVQASDVVKGTSPATSIKGSDDRKTRYGEAARVVSWELEGSGNVFFHNSTRPGVWNST